MAEHAKSTITNAAGVPWARAPGRWFIQGLVATADKVAWLEYPSESEASKTADVARSRWVWMSAAGGQPRIAASDLIAGASSRFGTDEAHLYLWLRSPIEALHSMPLDGGALRPLAAAPHQVNVGAAAGTVCFVSNEIHTHGLFCTPRGQPKPIEIAPVEGGTSFLVVLGDHVYWYERRDRCVLRARVDRAGAEPQRLSCSGLLMGPLASDGTRLYVLGGAITDEGDRTFAYAFEPTAGEWTLLRELPDDPHEIAAQAGHVAVLTWSSKHEYAVTVLDTTGRACVVARNQHEARHLALGVGRAFWTTEKTTLGHADLIEQSFTTGATNGPCAARAAPTSGK